MVSQQGWRERVQGDRGRPLPPRPRTAREPVFGASPGRFSADQVANYGSRPLPARTALAPDVRAGKIRRSPRTSPRRRMSAPRARGRGCLPQSPSGSSSDSPSAGGARGEDAHQSPQCHKIFSITSLCGGSMKATTSSGRHTDRMNMAHVRLQRRDAEGSRTLPRDGRGPQGIKPTPRRFPSSCALRSDRPSPSVSHPRPVITSSRDYELRAGNLGLRGKKSRLASATRALSRDRNRS